MKSNTIGENLKALRVKAGYNQQSIAAFLNVDQSFISKIENGERVISSDMLEKLAALFGVNPTDIIKEGTLSRTLSCAFRSNDLTFAEMETISVINRIALNAEFMKMTLEAHNG